MHAVLRLLLHLMLTYVWLSCFVVAGVVNLLFDRWASLLGLFIASSIYIRGWRLAAAVLKDVCCDM
jgi:hypothetical protein